MTRQQRRKEIRDLEKELEKIKKHTPFLKLLQDESLQSLTKEDMDILSEKKHEDKVLQTKYDIFLPIVQKVFSIEQRLQYLKVGFKAEPTQADSSTEHPDSPTA